MKYHEIATERPGPSKNAMPSTLFMWLIRRQLQNLWATRKLEMQVEIGGMGRKIKETTWKFFMHLCEFKVGMNAFAIRSYDFCKTCTKK